MEDLKKYFAKAELTPAIVQEKSTGEVLMMAYMNEESLRKTMETGYTAVPVRNSGIKAQLPAMCRKCMKFVQTVTMTPY